MKKDSLVFRSKTLSVSLRIPRRVPTVLFILILITLTAMVISLSQGEYPISPLAVIQTLLGLNTGNPDHAFIINTLRLPRIITACFVGMALAVSGTILQGITRNPLAEPGIIGMNAGAGFAAVSLIVVFPDVVSAEALPLSAFTGALTVAILVYLLAWDKGSSPIRLILVGIGIDTFLNAFTTLMETFGEIDDVSRALVWLAGSVSGRSWEEVLSLLPWLIVFVPLALVKAQQLNALALGDDIAKGLGSQVEWQRGLLLLTSAALCGAAVATAGTIYFVGLMAPHIARQLVGSTHEGLIPVSGMIGAMIVVVADLLGRTLFAPTEIPCGIVTAVIGAPYFIYLLVQNRKR
ncbi:FecCD family ABC transporter permease [Mastigocladopsis repens]|uniref:FecCD family ABC transporter permease n=1 Tax=Mastigocladopsis repens TaxID=221287 RepID=UPI000311D6B3|nr:iron ABC transporter permease [Mastigocladopsis repens]